MRMVGSRIYNEIRDKYPIDIRPVRYNPSFEGFMRPSVINICGIKDSGKSMLNECFALRHDKLIDLMSSVDNESLCWLRDTSPIDDILLVTGDNVDLDCSWDYKQIGDLTLQDILSYEATVTCHSFYHNKDKKFMGIQSIIELLYKRLAWTQGKLIYILIRESNSFIFSRISQGANQAQAKADFVYFTRELRHFGCTAGVDLLRWTATDKDLRDNADYTIFKQIGSKSLPNDKSFLYAFFEPVLFSRMKPWEFVIEKKDAALGFGTSPELPFHKEEGINLLDELGIKIIMGEDIEVGTTNILGDKEHEMLVRRYLDIDCRSMDEARSGTTYSKSTIQSHIKRHNVAIEEHGCCEKCKRLNSDIFQTKAINPRYIRE